MATKSTREHLIDVGVGLMHRNGYNATGLSEILNAADVPKGSFYHHFSSKEEFAGAVLEQYVMRVGELTATLLNDTKIPPLKRLRRYFRELIKVAGQEAPTPGCMIGRFSVEVAAVSPLLREQLSGSFDIWQGAVETVIRQAVAQKELPARTDVKSMAGFVLNSWEGALLRSQTEKSDAPLENFMSYVFDGLLTKRSKSR